ncbi:MAG: gamma-glutamylcyclotransferase, partial [Cyanobacteria bacterium P01_F01_bin.153]
HDYVVGPAYLEGYRLGFFRYSRRRQCGVLDIVRKPKSRVHGVLYSLPWRLSSLLDRREEGYIHHRITVQCQDQSFPNTRTYTVVDKLRAEHAPSDWYFDVVMRGALTCGLPESYCWQLFNHMHRLQQAQIAA